MSIFVEDETCKVGMLCYERREAQILSVTVSDKEVGLEW